MIITNHVEDHVGQGRAHFRDLGCKKIIVNRDLKTGRLAVKTLSPYYQK